MAVRKPRTDVVDGFRGRQHENNLSMEHRRLSGSPNGLELEESSRTEKQESEEHVP